MTKKSNSFKNITTVLLALLLIGIAAAPATAYAVNNATATIINGTAIANASVQNSINISFNTTNNSAVNGTLGIGLGNWSVNVSANPLTTNLTVLGSAWLNMTINATANAAPYLPTYLYGTNNTLLGGSRGFNASNGTIYVLLNTSNATDPNTFNVTFTNQDNTSESVTLTPLKFIAGPSIITLTNISTSAVANNSNNYTVNVSVVDAANNPIRNLTTTITLTSNRTQDTLTPSSFTFVANQTTANTTNITSYLAGQVMINATAPAVTNATNASSTNPVFIPGPAANLSINGSASVTGVVNNTQYVAIQDAFGNNVTADRLLGGSVSYSLLASIVSGSASIGSTNPLVIPSAALNGTNVSANGIAYSATFTPINFTVTANSVGAGAVTLQVTGNRSLNGTSRTITYYGSIASLNITTNKTTMYANNSDTVLVTVQLKDSLGNNILSPGVTIQLNSLNSALFNSADLSTTNSTNNFGVALFTVRSVAVSGTGTIGGTVTVNPAGNTGQTGTSSTITVLQAPSLTNSAVTNSSSYIFTGSNTTIIATVKDYNGAGVAIAGWPVTFNITNGSASATFANNSATLYTVSTDASGRAFAAINTSNATNNTPNVNVTLTDEKLLTQSLGLQVFGTIPGAVTTLSISPTTNQGLANVLGSSQVFTIQMKDIVGNVNNSANTSSTINITTSNPSLGNMSTNATTYTNNFVIAITGNTTFTYQVNSTTVGTAVLNLNSSLGIMTNITITTSGATGISLTFNTSTPLIGTNVTANAQLTANGTALGINNTNIVFTVTNAAGAIQSIFTNATNSTGVATYSFNQSVPGVYSVTATNATLTNTSTVTFAGQPSTVIVTANTTSPAVNGTVSINATLKDPSGIISGGVNGGTMQFLANGSLFGSATITNGVATTTYTQAAPGAVTITAFYNATLQNTTTVTFITSVPSVLSVSASPTTVIVGTPTNVTFNVTSSGTAVNGSTVALSGNATGSGTTGANGTVVISVNATSAGTITATASLTGYTSGSTTITASTSVLTSITVSPATKTLNIYNVTQTFTATPIDQFGNTMTNITVTWSSSNTRVGTIASSGATTGVFTPLAKSSITAPLVFIPVTITASSGNVSGNASVTVIPGSRTVGLYQNSTGTFFLKNSNTAGAADITVQFGPAGLIPLAGDYDGNGNQTIGVYSAGSTGTFFLKNSNTAGAADTTVQFGPGGSDFTPLIRRTDSNGTDFIAVYQKSTGTFFLKNSFSGGAADITVQFGPVSSTGDLVPLSGDWVGNGISGIGVYQKSTGTFFLKNTTVPGAADITVQFGPVNSTDIIPVTGDWNSDGQSTPGVYQKSTGTFFLKNSFSPGAADIAVQFGPVSSTGDFIPVTGDWDGR